MHEVFLDELRKLNTRFMGMGIDVSESIEEATQAFVDHDKKLAQSLVKDDQKVSRAATKVEKRTLKLMALQQPVASDFRNVISILKATGDLERIGENALSIAWETIRVKGNPRIPEVEAIIKSMSKKVNFMLDQVLKAYVQGDEKLAREVAKKDEELDEELEYRIVGSTESDILKGLISNESPLGKGLIGAKIGETVQVESPDGFSRYKILGISRE